jgi:uncharacterized membrane protein YhaH (DUF805 family)
MLAILTAMGVIFAMGFGRRVILLSGAAVLAAGLIFGALAIEIRQQGPRVVSTEQIFANTLSIVDGSSLRSDQGVDVRNLQSNTNWRLNWWGKIVGYTIAGSDFWSGRGFGINLATVDGFQPDWRGSLRSPHSIHMTILARTGVPGLVLWLILLTAIGSGLVHQARRMRRLGRYGWYALNVWILAYWAASVVNASFDVYIEGPQGGIWFWSLVGLAIAAIEIEKRAGPRSAAPGTAGFAGLPA